MPIAEYADLDATALADLVRRGDVTPSELVDEAIARMDALNPKINAVVHRMDDVARRTAKEPLSGPFAGVPFVVKDLDGYLAGAPYTGSCRFLADAKYVPAFDSEHIARFKRAGVVIVAKTNTPEFGILGTTEPELRGPTHNPWNLDHTPGGSSGGTAAAVAARIVPMGHAGDGGGSIRIPASACGLFGLKPTRGRNPLGPEGESWGGYVVRHVLSRSVRDSARMLDATQGADAGSPYVAPPPERPYADEVGRPPGKLRIAFSKGSLFGKNVHPDCQAAVDDAAKLLAGLGHEVVEDAPKIDREELVRAYLVQIAVGAASSVDDAGKLVGKRPVSSGFEPPTWLLAQIGRKLGAMDLHASREAAMKAGRALVPFFTKYDLFLDATLAQPPVRLGALALKPSERAGLAVLRTLPVKAILDRVLQDLADKSLEATPNTMLFNMTGQPAMSVPLSWSADGLPIGTQLVARFGEEGLLFRVAAQLEEARPWATRKPPMLSVPGARA